MSSNQNFYRIPHRVNAPMSIAFWDTDQVIPVFVAVGVGALFKMMGVAVVFAVIYFVIVGKVKDTYPRGFVRHKLWSLGLFPIGQNRSLPDPTKREFYQ